jgi:hypothetical protein
MVGPTGMPGFQSSSNKNNNAALTQEKQKRFKLSNKIYEDKNNLKTQSRDIEYD